MKWLGDCERCLAWTILTYAQEKEAREAENEVNQPIHDLLQTLDMFNTMGSSTPVVLENNKDFDTFPALVADILDTT
nr:hypothetical protein [Tanacetum cinerariifolium]